MANYEKTIQTAFREVADSMAATGTYDRQIRAQRTMIEEIRETERLSRMRFRNGVDDYFSVFDAQRQLYSAQQQLVAYRPARLDSEVSLYRPWAGLARRGRRTAGRGLGSGFDRARHGLSARARRRRGRAAAICEPGRARPRRGRPFPPDVTRRSLPWRNHESGRSRSLPSPGRSAPKPCRLTFAVARPIPFRGIAHVTVAICRAVFPQRPAAPGSWILSLTCPR